MNKDTVRPELDRLISEAEVIAPTIRNVEDGGRYGSVTDESLNLQQFERWELEVGAVIGELAASSAKVFVDLNAKYLTLKGESRDFHSKSIFVHKALLLLQSARQLLNSAVAAFEIGISRPQTLQVRISAIVDAQISLIVDAVSA